MKHPVGTTKNEQPVYVDLIHSRAAKHISAQPQLLVLIREALSSHSPIKDRVVLEYDMRRPIGYDFTVSTTEKDVVFYAQLIKSSTYTPFVKNGTPISTSKLSVILTRNDDGNYDLSDAWIGSMSPALPGSEEAAEESKEYWSSHAVVYTNQAIHTKSITKTNPY